MNKNVFKVIVFVILMGTGSASLLVGVDNFTKPFIRRNDELKLKTAVLDALEIQYEQANVIKLFDSQIKTLPKDKYTFYQSADNSVAFEFHGPGLWGPISGIISLEKDLKTIRKIKITYQEETPGLGSRIADADYLSQFKSKEISPQIIFMPAGKAINKNEVDAITGATGSCRALEKLLNSSVQESIAAFKG